jgi:hypothetical protein
MSATDQAPDSPFAFADARMANAPSPTPRTLRRRSSLPLQIWRFGLLNIKILRMVLKGHSG